jgi:YhcH/YjgK/YiaL family protein
MPAVTLCADSGTGVRPILIHLAFERAAPGQKPALNKAGFLPMIGLKLNHPNPVRAASHGRFKGIRMILDVLENAHRYTVMHKGFAKAMEFLLRPDLTDLPVGEYAIDGKRAYAMVSRDMGRKKEEALLETHEKYIDIQLILEGTDDIGWKPKSLCKQPSAAYDNQSDLQFFTDTPDTWLSIKSGAFAIFFPEDAHMPLISSGQIHKVVVKIAAL